MAEGQTCYENDEAFCEDQMCLRTGCRLKNAGSAKDAQIADWIAYADKLEAALKLACGQRSDILMRMHAEQGLRLVRPE